MNEKLFNNRIYRQPYYAKDYLTKYTIQPKDIESALKKIENLHIALKKKIDKNKNQALEITKLLKDKEEYKQNIDMVLKALNTTLKELTAKNEELQSNLDYKNECTKQLINDKESLKNEIKIKDKVIKQLIEQINKVNIDIEDTLKSNLDKLKEKDTIISYLESKLK